MLALVWHARHVADHLLCQLEWTETGEAACPEARQGQQARDARCSHPRHQDGAAEPQWRVVHRAQLVEGGQVAQLRAQRTHGTLPVQEGAGPQQVTRAQTTAVVDTNDAGSFVRKAEDLNPQGVCVQGI